MKLFTICRLLLSTAALAIAAALPARAQIVIDTARGVVGKEMYLTLHAPGLSPARTGTITVSGTMKLSNPTVFFPQKFITPGADVLEAFTLQAQADSIYKVSFTIRRDQADPSAGDTLVRIMGEALAGSDSVCIVTLYGTTLGGTAIQDSRGVVITRSVGTPLPYVRFAILEQNYPNPVPRNTPTRWAYRIDKRSDVTFHFYDLTGKEIYREYLGVQDIGSHMYVYQPHPTIPTGPYYVRLVTNSGTADKVMLILH